MVVFGEEIRDSKLLTPSGAPNQKPQRPPLLPSQVHDNGPRRSKLLLPEAAADNGIRRPKSREISSRYLTSTPSSTTTTLSSPSPSPVNKRSKSAERRRPLTPRPGDADEMLMSSKMLMKSSRSLSVSFQGESFASFPVSKEKPKPTPTTGNSLRNCTPVSRKPGVEIPSRDQTENSKPTEQDRSTRSLDFTSEKRKLRESGSVVVRALQKSIIDERRDNRFVNDSASVSVSVSSESVAPSDTESVPSDGGAITSQVRGGGRPRGVVVPARIWQETPNQLKRVPEPSSSPVSKNNKLFSANKLLSDGPVSPTRRMVSNTPATVRSPTRSRNGVVMSNGNLGSSRSILSFAAEARGGKVGENRIVDAHELKMLHNKLLQWRFANARADAAMSFQRETAEKSLYNAWVTTTKLGHSVRAKRTEIQLLKQNLKMFYILKNQMPYLNDWDHAEKDHFGSLDGTIVALESRTLRLPVVAGAKSDNQNMKDAICSAVDVMEALASSICSLDTKVENVNSLVSELANVTTNESISLDQCNDLLSTITAMQVKHCSLRTHILQQNHASSSITTEL